MSAATALKVRGCCLLDRIAVERVVASPETGIALNHCEQRAALARLHALDYSDARIGLHLGVHATRVQRVRDELGLPAIPQEDQHKRRWAS